MKTFLLIFSLFFTSCAFYRLGSQYSPEKKIQYQMKGYHYQETINGEKSEATYIDYRRGLVKEFLLEDVFSKEGDAVDVEVRIDNRKEDIKKHRLKLREKDGWQDLTLSEAWFRTSMYSATLIPFWGTSEYTAHVKISKNNKKLCEKSCDGSYFYMQFLPLIVITPFSFYFNEKKFQKDLAGYCVEQCLAK